MRAYLQGIYQPVERGNGFNEDSKIEKAKTRNFSSEKGNRPGRRSKLVN